MDWTDPMMTMFGLNPESNAQVADLVEDDDEEDFYDDEPAPADDAQAGAQAPLFNYNNTEQQKQVQLAAPTVSPEAKAAYERRAQQLRATLLEKRKNTPLNMSRSNTPAQPPKAQAPKESQPDTIKTVEPMSSAVNVDALINRGKALADAAIAAKNKISNPISQPQTNGESTQKNNTVKQEEEVTAAPQPEQAKEQPEQPTRPSELNDEYYADLQAWLELTGYHDVEFRTSKLATYKQRRELEQEAARIAEALEKLKQEEQGTFSSLRSGTPMPPTAATNLNMAPPPLPQSMPVEKVAPKTNGFKRAHSPERLPPGKNKRQDGGFRIRGANESPDARPGSARRPPTPSPTELERRISYPDARRRSSGSNHNFSSKSRDPSLERRQSYYRQDTDRGDKNQYDNYNPRDGPRPRYDGPSRSNPMPFKAPPSQYRGSAALDFRKGGVRFFMIKSVFHENVVSAQREDIWATQEKNEKLLADAFATSRHVVLLFSVNKSMHFAGYALMTSPPDPSLPKPSWASKLNWGTSAAFTLRWLATTPIHFRNVGHLKNELNVDEKGEARAVLVGKDGQEISKEAGMGTVWIMDEAEAQVVERGERR